MKHLKKINESSNYKKQNDLFINTRVIDVSNIRDTNIRDIIYKYAENRVRSNNSYFKYYVCDTAKHISEVKDINNIIRFPNHNPDYVYERGDDPISDFLLDNGAKLSESLIFLINW